MMDNEVLNGIDDGTITDPDAVHVYVSKSLDAVRGIYQGDELKKIEAEYAPLVYGEPGDLVHFCLGHANEFMALNHPTARENPAQYDTAARWYRMAARMAQPAATSQPLGARPAAGASRMTEEQHVPVDELARMSADEVKQAIDAGTTSDLEAVHVYVRKSLERDRLRYDGDRLREIEAQYAELFFADPKDMVRYCLQQAESRMPLGDGLDAAAGDLGAVSRWYAMAARFARQAASERRMQQDDAPSEPALRPDPQQGHEE
jgi:hypothetical protein